jgi:hypothetical protein
MEADERQLKEAYSKVKNRIESNRLMKPHRYLLRGSCYQRYLKPAAGIVKTIYDLRLTIDGLNIPRQPD